MKAVFAVLAGIAVTGCGVETAGSAATAAGIKKQEMEQGANTMKRAQEKIDQSMEQARQRAGETADK